MNIVRSVSPFLLLLVACGAYRLSANAPAPALPVSRGTPLKIESIYNIPAVATDEQLRQVLSRMKPPTGPANTNIYVHALRLWGAKVDFGDPAIPSGHELRDYFLDDYAYQLRAGMGAPALFARTADGLQARTWAEADPQRNLAAVHTDDLLSTLAEIGTPLHAEMRLRNGTAQVGELLNGALDRYHPVQAEYEWTAIAYARFLLPATSWTNHFGQKISVDDLIDQLIDHPLDEGVCGGTHRLEALVVLYRANEQMPVLSKRAKHRILEHLARMSGLLIQSQHADGHWSRTWYRGPASLAEQDKHPEDQMLLTGHHLEWLALAPAEVQPPRETIVRASQWLIKTILETEQVTLVKRYGPLSHAARALCLWRGKEAGEVWGQGE